MAVARSDEGPGNLTRRRLPRKAPDVAVPGSAPTSAPPTVPRSPSGLRLDDLYRLPMPKLFALAEREGVAEHTGMNRGQLIVSVVRQQVVRGEIVRGAGTLEVLPDGYGFLRSAAHNYLASPEDIYVSPSQIRRLGLRTGLVVEGPIRLPIEGQENFALMQVELVNGHQPEEKSRPTVFEDLTPLHPHKRILLETTAEELAARVIDLVTPIGKGQRGLIVSPPRAGKTVLLQKIALAIKQNHPESYLIVLLIDERPEEVTDMVRDGGRPERRGGCQHVRRAVVGARPRRRHRPGEGQAPGRGRPRRGAAFGLDHPAGAAHNTEAPSGGKLLSGGLDSNAMQKPKRSSAPPATSRRAAR